MASRSDLQTLLEGIMTNLEFDPDEVYFQPPPDVELSYPAIIYTESKHDVLYADNDKYRMFKQYDIQIIDKNGDCVIPDEIEKLEYCSFDRLFISDNLYHWNYTLFY